MRRFSWSLQRLLDLADQQEQLLARQFGELSRQVEEVAAARRRRQREIERTLAVVAAMDLAGRLDRSASHQAWFAAAAGDVEALAARQAEMETQRQRARQELMDARSWRRRLERLRQRAMDAYDQQALRVEQLQLDETAQGAAARRIRASAARPAGR